MGTFLPFWFQKGIKIWNFVDATYIFGKYESSAFQNRSQNILSTSGYDFMSFWSLVKTAKNRGGDRKNNRHKLSIFSIFMHFEFEKTWSYDMNGVR